MGRIDAIAHNPNNENEVYAGSHNGGIFKTSNFLDVNPTWVNISEHSKLPGFGVTQLLIDKENGSQKIYAAVSIGDGISSQGAILVGLYKSTDDGLNWSQILPTNLTGPSSTISAIRALVMDPNNHNHIYLLTATTLFETTNGFATINDIYTDVSEDFQQFKIMPGNAAIACLAGHKLLKTTDGWNSSSDLTNFIQPPSNFNPNNYTVVTENLFYSMDINSNGIYAIRKLKIYDNPNSNNLFVEGNFIFSSTDTQNQTWTSNSVAKRGWFSVNACNPAIMYIGETQGTQSFGNLWKSINGGATFTDIDNYSGFMSNGTYTHADIRFLDYTCDVNGIKLWIGNDGGVLYSEDGGANFLNKNGKGLTAQIFSGFGVSEKNKNVIIGGLMDSGVMSKAKINWYSNFTNQDGYDCVIDPNDATQGFGFGNATLYKFNGIGTNSLTNTGISTCPGFVNDWQMYNKPIYSNQAGTFYTAYNDLFKYTASSDSWTQISNVGQTNQLFKVVDFNINESNPNVIYIAYQGPTWNPNVSKKLYKTTNGGASWTDISVNLPHVENNNITGVVSDPENADRIWVTFGGFSNVKVDYSDNGGQSFISFSDGLPAFPVTCIEYQRGSDDLIYVGTDIGVFVYNKSDLEWQCFNKNAPITMISDLEVNYCSNKIIASHFGRGLWETELLPNSEKDIVLNSPSNTIVWNNGYTKMYNNIIIKSGTTLKVQQEIDMPVSKKIIVERGATLIIDGPDAKITNACQARWPGIQVWGNSNVPQNSANAAQFGKVIVRNGGTIENAETGIITMKIDEQGNWDWDWNYSGGIVQCTDANFINNGRDVSFLNYANLNANSQEMITQSYFTKTNFITNDSYNYKELAAPQWHVTIDHSSGIRFKGCTFKNLKTTPPTDYSGTEHLWAGGGIYTINSQLFVDQYCSGFSLNCNNAIPTTFENLREGILVTGTLKNRKLNCLHSRFINNATNGISVRSQNYANIIANDFIFDNSNLYKYDSQSGLYQIGTLISLSAGYRVEENTYLGDNALWSQAGIKIVNSGGAPNEIYRNTFTNLYYGATALGTNKNTKINTYGVGLQLLCLTHQNNKWDNAVTKKVNEPGIALYQGNLLGPNFRTADNTFSNITGTGCTDLYNYYNECEFINYAGSSNLQYSPTLYDCNSIYVSNNIATNTGCPTKIGLHKKLNAAERQTVATNLNLKMTDLRDSKLLLNLITDGGNTYDVINAITQSQPAQTQQLVSNLLSLSPNVSLPVLLKVAYENDKLSPTLQMLILVANTQGGKNQRIIDTLRYKQNPMDPAMVDFILDNRNNTSLKEKMESKVTTLAAEKDYLALVLINDLMEDTTGVNSDSIALLIDKLEGDDKYYTKIYKAIADNNFNLADSLYTALGDSIEDKYLRADFESLAQILEIEKVLKNSNRNYHQLDSMEIETLRLIAIGEYATKGMVMAQNILSNAVGDKFEPYLKFPEEVQERRSKPSQKQSTITSSFETSFFNLYPNPIKSATNLSYVLLPGQKGVVSIADSNGKVVYENVLSNDQSSLSIDLSMLAPSTYFLSVLVNNEVKYNETLVIKR